MNNQVESTMTSDWFESPIVTKPTNPIPKKALGRRALNFLSLDSTKRDDKEEAKISNKEDIKAPNEMLRVQVKRSGGDTIVYSIDKNTTGAVMLAKCGKLRGLRQYDYFGLSYVGTDGHSYYIDDDQKIRLSPLLKPASADGIIELQLKPMFYPDSIDELIETKLIRLFFDQDGKT